MLYKPQLEQKQEKVAKTTIMLTNDMRTQMLDKLNATLSFITKPLYRLWNAVPAYLSNEKPEKILFLAFEIKPNIMICSPKPPSVQQFVRNFHLAVQILV